MLTLGSLWLPILLSAAFVFIVSSVVHMVLQLHKNDYRRLPDEDATLDAMRRTGVVPGQYVFPHCSSMKDLETPAMQQKFKVGPIGTLIVRPGIAMGAALMQWFVFCIVVAVFTAYLTSLVHPAGASSGDVFRVAATVALLGHGFSSVTDSIWKGVSWSTTAKFVFDGVLYSIATGAVFMWLWPAAA